MDFEYEFERLERFNKRKKIVLSILRWVIDVACVVALAYFFVLFAFVKTNMSGVSMETTLQNGDVIIVNKLAYIVNDPKRFDVIVYSHENEEHNYYDIKRIIGLPGETVQIIKGEVYINGNPLEEPMIVDPAEIGGTAQAELVLEDDEYFVLGDNRNASEDSRFAHVGNIVRNEIVGKAFIRTNNFAFVNTLNKYGKKQE